jgi:DNA-binding NarL/FixJ family response regulator
VIDANPAVRKGVTARLNRHPNLEVVGSDANVVAGCHAARTAKADVLIIDYPVRGSTLSCLRRLRNDPASVQVIALGHLQADTRADCPPEIDLLLDKDLDGDRLVSAIVEAQRPRARSLAS